MGQSVESASANGAAEALNKKFARPAKTHDGHAGEQTPSIVARAFGHLPTTCLGLAKRHAQHFWTESPHGMTVSELFCLQQGDLDRVVHQVSSAPGQWLAGSCVDLISFNIVTRFLVQ